jgi:hypothetical protein
MGSFMDMGSSSGNSREINIGVIISILGKTDTAFSLGMMVTFMKVSIRKTKNMGTDIFTQNSVETII